MHPSDTPPWLATLDLRDPAKRGLDWLKATDPERLVREPGKGWWHGWGYGDVTGRMVEAFVLARRILGENELSPEEERTRRFLISLFDAPDGLSWRPESPFRRRAAHMFDQSSVLFGLVSWFMEPEDPSIADCGLRIADLSIRNPKSETRNRIAERIEPLINGLCEIAEWHGDWCFYPLEVYTPTGWTENYGEFRDGRQNVKADPCHEGGRQIMPLVTYYELTGYENALRLAEGLTRFVIHHSGVFEEDGGYLERKSRATGHVHSRLGTAAGVMKLGLITGRTDWIAWAKHVFDWTLSNLASSFGWVSERAHGSEGGSETCCITDALELAITLAENGYPEYWDVAERFVRNHLVESQCPDTGGFSGHSMPNDFCWIYEATGQLEHHVGGCCSPAGIRGLWLAWDRIVTRTEDGVSVHFPLNRISRWADVISGLPYQGKVKVIVHDALASASKPDLFVRIPKWASSSAVRLMVNAKARAVAWEGRYVKTGGLAEGDEVVVTYPVRRERITESFMDFAFEVTWRGNTVVAIEPPGDNEPLYRRSEMDTEDVPLRKAG